MVIELSPSSNSQPTYHSSIAYLNEAEAIAAGVQFIQRQKALSVLWEFLYDAYTSTLITEPELDRLSESLCLFCCFKDSHSDSGYWYR